LRRVLEAISDGYVIYFKSDIASFFTGIPHAEVVSFIREETGDSKISSIFMDALSTEINNKDALGEYFSLFPSDGIGVPQGSSLSALAGNILLHGFDLKMNSENDIVCYRYIDDVIVLGKSNEAVQSARSLAIKHLRTKGLSLYDPAEHPDKAANGHTRDGFIYLGCRISPGQTEPSSESRQKLLNKIDQEINNAKKNINDVASRSTDNRYRQVCYSQSLSRIDRMVYSWGTSYSFCNNKLPFKSLDSKISRRIENYQNWFRMYIGDKTEYQKRRALGICMLDDIFDK